MDDEFAKKRLEIHEFSINAAQPELQLYIYIYNV